MLTVINNRDITVAQNYKKIKEKLKEISIVCDNLLNLTPYTKKILFIEILKTYIKVFDKDNYENNSRNEQYYRKNKRIFCFGKLISRIKDLLNNSYPIDFSELNQYVLILKTYNTLIQELMTDILDCVKEEEVYDKILNFSRKSSTCFR